MSSRLSVTAASDFVGRKLKGVPFWLAVLFLAALIGIRNPVPLFRAELWAEDGSCFFLGWWEHGISSLWMPVTGYHLFLSRLVAWLAGALFPIIAIPYAYAAAALFVNAVALAYFVRDGFGWIIASKSARLFIAALVAIGPGSAEVFLNLANLQVSLTWLGMLLLLEKPRELGRVKLVLLVGIFFSTGSAFLMAPLLIVLLATTRRRAYLFLFLALVANMALNTLSHARDMETSSSYANARFVPDIIVSNLALRFLLLPFFGEHGALPVFRSSLLAFLSVSLAAAIVAVAIIRQSGWAMREKLLLVVLAVSTSTVFGVISLTRAYNLPLLQRGTGYVLWDLRYSFLPGATAIVIWVSALLRIRSKEATAGIGLILLNLMPHWANIPARPDLHWPRTARELSGLLKQQRARGDGAPLHFGPVPLQPPSYGSMTVTIKPESRGGR